MSVRASGAHLTGGKKMPTTGLLCGVAAVTWGADLNTQGGFCPFLLRAPLPALLAPAWDSVPFKQMVDISFHLWRAARFSKCAHRHGAQRAQQGVGPKAPRLPGDTSGYRGSGKEDPRLVS